MNNYNNLIQQLEEKHKLLVRMRASSTVDFFDCPERWIAVNLEGLTVPTHFRAAIGTAVHAGTAYYDNQRIQGEAPDINAATEFAAQTLMDDDDEIVWDKSRQDCLKIAVYLTYVYCKEVSHRFDFAVVEANCDNLELHDLGLVLTGSTDRIYQQAVTIEDTGEVITQYGIADIKTGIAAVDGQGEAKTQAHGAQIGTYEILAQASIDHPMELPGVIIGLKSNAKYDSKGVGVGEITNGKEILLGNDETMGLLQHAALMIHQVIPPYGNPKSMMCSEKFCPKFSKCFWRS